MRHGVIVKLWLESGFDTFIRVTVGRSEDNEHFRDALQKFMAQKSAVARSTIEGAHQQCKPTNQRTRAPSLEDTRLACFRCTALLLLGLIAEQQTPLMG